MCQYNDDVQQHNWWSTPKALSSGNKTRAKGTEKKDELRIDKAGCRILPIPDSPHAQ